MNDELRKAAQAVVDAWDAYCMVGGGDINPLRAALANNANAAPEQEPVGEVVEYIFGKHEGIRFSVFPAGYSLPIGTKLYTHPMPAPAAPEQQPVAWVEVTHSTHKNYTFHGIEYLPIGKHNLYTAPVAAPELQPVAWMGYSGVGEKIVSPKAIYSWMTIPLYIAPVAAPQREWAELEDDEVTEIADRCTDVFGLADLISEALRAKNEVKNHG